MGKTEKTIQRTFHFRECENYGDLSCYEYDIIISGGRIVSSELLEGDCGLVVVEFSSAEAEQMFWEKFSQTDSYDFAS